MPRTKTGRQDTRVVTAQCAVVVWSWSMRWNAICPAMPSEKEKIAASARVART